MSAFRQAKLATAILPSTQWSPVVNLWQAPAWLADARRAISQLADLKPGWDGGVSPAPQSTAIRAASLLLDQLDAYEPPIPSIGPIVGGGLGIEWHNGMRNLDLEILPDGTIEFLKSEKTSNGFDVNAMEDGQISPDNLREAKKLIRWLMGC